MLDFVRSQEDVSCAGLVQLMETWRRASVRTAPTGATPSQPGTAAAVTRADLTYGSGFVVEVAVSACGMPWCRRQGVRCEWGGENVVGEWQGVTGASELASAMLGHVQALLMDTQPDGPRRGRRCVHPCIHCEYRVWLYSRN